MANTPPDVMTLAEYIGGDFSDQLRLDQTLAVAVGLVDLAFKNAYREVPDDVYQQVVLDAGLNVWNRRNNQTAGGSYPVGGGFAPVQANDPLQKSRPIIGQYVIPL